MSDENSSGSAYLAGLKRSTPQAAGAALAPARTPEKQTSSATAATTKPQSAEKRRSPRYRCQGSTHLREAGSGVAIWATFTDISLHGCYVEARSTFAAGTRLALTIEVNGFRVEAEGDVRVVYPNLGMGISFTNVSDLDRERLRELLGSISQPSVILGTRSITDLPARTGRGPLSSVANPSAVLQAIEHFFDERRILSQEEFFRILRKFQNSET